MSEGLAFERAPGIPSAAYKDASTIIIVPERDPMFHFRWIQHFMGMIGPMNQKRHIMFVIGEEVGHAYTDTIKQILANAELSKWKYILTVESDNLVPADAHIRLLESIEECKLDAVGGLYWTKGDLNQPMAYGDAQKYASTGVLDFAPIDVRAAMQKSAVVEVNGLGMGCTLFRMELFKQLDPPWFVTVNDVVPGQGVKLYTQDLYFFEKARRTGKRFGCDTRVRVGHMDLKSGTVY